MNTSEKLYIVIPAYNEMDNIDKLIREWYPIVEKINAIMLVIDDGSRDNTFALLKEQEESRPNLKVLSKKNGGHGDTLLYGYRYAIQHKAEWLFQTDSDGQTSADEFQEFWELRNKYDAIFGCRKKRGDGVSRKFVENVLCFILWCIFGIKVPDANCPFRLMKADRVKMYINKMPEHYFLPNVMLTVYFMHYQNRVLFKEITFTNRKGGKNSINIAKIIRIGLESIEDCRKFRREMQSLV